MMSRPRSSSIPRHFHRHDPPDRFSVTDAAHLKLQLQALDAAISGDTKGDLGSIRIVSACPPRPFHETVYIDGSEEFYLLVKRISRPDLIPHIYVQAYEAALQGRHHVNRYSVSDFLKGVDPTFSEIRPLLSQIDHVCETDLGGAYQRLEDKVKPFPFLRLPPELRLHVYAHLIPREPHIAVLYQPMRDHAPRLRLDIMRVSSQIHNETRKYLYENRILFLLCARDHVKTTLVHDCLTRSLAVVVSMNSQTRRLFKKLEIQVQHVSHYLLWAQGPSKRTGTVDSLAAIVSRLPSLETVIISPCSSRHTPSLHHFAHQDLAYAVTSLLEFVPPSLDIIWDLTRAIPPRAKREDHPLWPTIQARGTIKMGAGALAQLENALE